MHESIKILYFTLKFNSIVWVSCQKIFSWKAHAFCYCLQTKSARWNLCASLATSLSEISQNKAGTGTTGVPYSAESDWSYRIILLAFYMPAFSAIYQGNAYRSHYDKKKALACPFHRLESTFFVFCPWRCYRAFQSVVLNGCQEMTLRAFYITRTLILLHKPLSAPSFGRYWKYLIRSPYRSSAVEEFMYFPKIFMKYHFKSMTFAHFSDLLNNFAF